MKNDVFRKMDDEEINSPEKLDEVMTVVKPTGWATNIAILLILIWFVNWLINGNISHTVDADGILISDYSIKKITVHKEGKISDVKVVKGDKFSENIVLIEIEEQDNTNNDSSEQIKVNRNTKKNIIYSGFKGTVLDVFVSKGDIVYPGEILMLVEKNIQTTELEGILFVNYENSGIIEKGMNVKISTQNIKKEEFGEIIGVVESVSRYPVSYESMVKRIPLKELVEGFLMHGSVVEVRVKLEKDHETYSGLKWTSSKGPKTKISNGIFCTGKISISNEKPISLLGFK